MSLIAWIVLGLIAGGIANWAVKGGFGLIGTLVLGVIGAVVGGFIANFLVGGGNWVEIDYWSILFSVFGAILVIGFAKVVFGRGESA